MAAVDPSQSVKRKDSPVEKMQDSGEVSKPGESECISKETGIIIHETLAESLKNEEANCSNNGDYIASDPGISNNPQAGADTTCSSLEDQTKEKTADSTDLSHKDHQRSSSSEAESSDDGGSKTNKATYENVDHRNGTEKPELQPDTPHVSRAPGAEVPRAQPAPDQRSVGRDAAGGPEGEAEDDDDDDDDDCEDDCDERAEGAGGDEADAVKPRRQSLQCKECGMRFSRRETFNLHRHFHARKDDLTPLTCKECGLTFPQRTDLIKHRHEHKEEKEACTKAEGGFKCAQCETSFSTVGRLRGHSCRNTPEKPYHCPLCRQEFQFKQSVSKHIQSHSTERAFACQECNQRFGDPAELRSHQRCHAALKPYECPECGLVFRHYSVMEDHRRRHAETARSHQCNICDKAFKYSSLLHQHQYLHTGKKRFRCPECGKRFAFAQNMKAHFRQHRLHANDPDRSSDQLGKQNVKGPAKENTNRNVDLKRAYNCPLCPQTFNVPAKLRDHMFIHELEHEKLENRQKTLKANIMEHCEKGYPCPNCPCTFQDEESHYRHMLRSHNSIGPYLQKLRTKPIQKLVPLSNNTVQGKWSSDVIGSKSYKCPECGKVFRHRSVLELHMRIHSKDKPFQCKVCGKSFRFGSYLQQHIIIHTGKKPYKCPDCGKDFAFLQNMKTHQKLHQVKPFRCTSCRKGYSDEVQLQHHILTHNGEKPHKCKLCDKSFGLAYLLRDHMNTHTGERPHRCEECPKSFSWLSSLLVHQKTHARKRQGVGQYSAHLVGPRVRGRGGRGRRGSRSGWGWSRSGGGAGMTASHPPPAPTASAQVDFEAKRQKEPWAPEMHPSPIQWRVDGGEVMPAPLAQQPHVAPQQAAQFDAPSQSGPLQRSQRTPDCLSSSFLVQPGASVQVLGPTHTSENTILTASSFLAAAPCEINQQSKDKPVTWGVTPTSLALASTSSSQHEVPASQSYIDRAALWSVRPIPVAQTSESSSNRFGQELQLPRWSNAPISTQKASNEPPVPLRKDDNVWDFSTPPIIDSAVSLSEKQWNGCEPTPWTADIAGTSTPVQTDQSSAMSSLIPVPHGLGSTLWDFQSPPGLPKTDKLCGNQDFPLHHKQTSPGWAHVQNRSSPQQVPISIQYDAPRIQHGIGTGVWGFQTNPLGPQGLLGGQLKPGSGQELHHQPMVTGAQIIINQPPFFTPQLAPLPPLALPGPHPLHTVAVGALQRAPNIFFTPQAVMSKAAHMQQTLSLVPRIAPRPDPHKLEGRLPFAPERLLQCMICGCSFPGDLELQMHYVQHAQGEV